jgi:membrane peptidoglycan carboxypeptidase
MKASRRLSRTSKPRNTVTTRSGSVLSTNRSLNDKLKSKRLSRQASKAVYLSTLPKNRIKRILYRLHPKRIIRYSFSREGGILALKLLGIGIVLGFFVTIGMFAYFKKDLPKIKDLSGKIGGSITYYDRTGTVLLWQDYDAVKRTPVKTTDMSLFIKQATVAIEDKNFYHEGAFDIRGIMRAAIHDAIGGGGSLQGGSTITQQLVKLNENWTDNRTVTRKVKELILSVELERQYNKDDILTGYLNMAPYGGLDYGVETAARDYFGVSAKDLSLAQAAMLAAIPQAPNYYSPYGSTQFNPSASNTFNKGALIGRQHYILDQMVKQGYIKKDQAEVAKLVDILAQVKPLSSKYSGIKAPYFVLAAKNQLLQKYSEKIVAQGGWKITTTLDISLQNKAEELVASNLSNVRRYGGDTEATVVENVPTGQIQALVGGVDFTQPDYGQLNFADQVLVPPGSSFKPYDYTSLINTQSMNAGAGSVLYDSKGPIVDPATGAGYACTNTNNPKYDKTANCLWDYDFRFPGPLTLRYAIGGSRNVPAVKAMILAGVNKTIGLASAMMDNTYLQSQHQNTYNCYASGTDLGTATAADTTPCYPSSAIGDGAFLHIDDHVNGLATLARMGNAIPRTFILQINDASGNTIYKWDQPKGTQVVSADTAYIMNNMLSDPNPSYLNPNQKFQHQDGWNFAIKTGTTNDNFDGLMTSWSTQYAVVSWVGYHTRNKALTGGHMENMTEPLTRGLMEFAHAKLKPVNWTQPSTIKAAPAYVINSHVGLGSVEPTTASDIYPGWYQAKTGAKDQVTDKVSGLIATSCTPDLAKSAPGDSNINAFSIDKFIDGSINKNTTTTGTTAATDNIHNCGDVVPQINPPVLNSTGTTCTVGSPCSFVITVTSGTHPFNDAQYPNFPGTINLLSGSTVVESAKIVDSNCSNSDATSINAACTVTLTFAPSAAGDVSITAQVIDSVLYSATSGATALTINPAASAINILTPLPSSTKNGPHVAVTWSGGSGKYSVTLDNSPVAGCQDILLMNCDLVVIASKNSKHTVVVTDSNLDPKDSVDFFI